MRASGESAVPLEEVAEELNGGIAGCAEAYGQGVLGGSFESEVACKVSPVIHLVSKVSVEWLSWVFGGEFRQFLMITYSYPLMFEPSEDGLLATSSESGNLFGRELLFLVELCQLLCG